MIRHRHFFFVVLALLLILPLAACIAPQEQTSAPPSNGAVEAVAPVVKNNSEPVSLPSKTQPAPVPTPLPSPFSATAFSDAIADVVEQVEPAVVFISAEIIVKNFFNQDITQATSGSGIIISPEGYILTNNHVVRNANRLEVTLPNVAGAFEAKLIGTDPLTDLAVIKIKGQEFPIVPFGDASKLRPGNLVIALGNPLGLYEGGPTITLGVVSNLGRSLPRIGESTFYDVIQTDAAINPGNSGGPLVNLNGEVVGINTILAFGAQNIGFAISANTAQPVYEALIAPPHRVIRPWLGVVLQTVTPDLAAKANLPRRSGVAIVRIEEGSPAGEAGLMSGDVITHFQGEEVTEATQLIKTLWRYKVGEQVEITFWRGEEEKTVIVKPVERPEGL